MADKKIAFQVEIQNIEKVTKLKEELKKLRKQNRELEKDTAKNTKAGKFAAAQYDKNAKAIGDKSKKLRDLNKAIKTNTADTGKATKSNNSMAKQFLKASAAIGIVVGAFRAVNRIVSSVVSVFTEFEFTMAKVLAVSGATTNEFNALSESAQELGRTTFFTAQQVAELQLNYSKLGFSAAEILDAQEATLALATATGSDLARSATVAGAAVRGFGLDASETGRVVDVMAVSFSSSAMDIEKWQTSMTKVAPIAKAAGFSIEDTAAIMSKLTDAGIEASIAGTSLRNILLKMQDPASDLSQAFGGTIHSLDELVPAMKKFVEEGGDMASIMEVVDLRQAAAFEQMITSADATLELRDKLKDARGEAKRMADIIGNTLQGSFLKFSSALQGLSISIMKDFAAGLQNGLEKLAKFLNALAENSKVITTTIGVVAKLVKWLGIYKVTIMAIPAVQAAVNTGIIAFRGAAAAATTATMTLSGALATLKLALQRLLGATGIGLLVVAATELASRWLLAKDSTDDYVEANEKVLEQAERLQAINDHTDKLMRTRLGQSKKAAQDNIDMLQKEKTMTLSILHSSKQGLNELTKEEEEAHRKRIKRLNFRIKLEKKNLDEIIDKEEKQKELEKDLIYIQEQKLAKAREIVTTDEASLKAKNKKIKAIENEISRLQSLGVEEEKIEDIDQKKIQKQKDYIAVMKGVLDGSKSLIDAEKELRDKVIERLDAELKAMPITEENLHKRIELEAKLIELKTKNIKKTENAIDKELKATRKLIREYSSLGGALQTIAGDSDELNGIRQAGEAITRAAAVAEALLTLRTTAQALAKGELNLATLLGTQATQADTAATVTNTTVTAADTAATTVDTVATTADTAATGVNTAVTTTNMAVEASSIPVKVASGAASQAKLPWPLNIIAIIATLGILGKILGVFEKGGVIDEKFARGGMVHGKSHAQGGEKFAVGGRVVELEGGEAVINKRSTAMYKDQLSAINQAGGGRKFADGGLLNMPKFTTARFGNTNQGTGAQKVYVVESDISSTQNSVSVIQAGATI